MNAFLIRLLLPLVAALALFTGGCSAVSVPGPVGDKPHVLNPDDWAGTWLAPDGDAVSVIVSDASKGELQVVGVEFNRGEAALKTHTIHVRESAGWLFASLTSDDADRPGQCLWARLKIEKNQVVIWSPDVAAFRALVRSGQLKGKATDSGDVELEQIPPEKLAALPAGDFGIPLEWDSPFVLRRVGR